MDQGRAFFVHSLYKNRVVPPDNRQCRMRTGWTWSKCLGNKPNEIHQNNVDTKLSLRSMRSRFSFHCMTIFAINDAGKSRNICPRVSSRQMHDFAFYTPSTGGPITTPFEAVRDTLFRLASSRLAAYWLLRFIKDVHQPISVRSYRGKRRASQSSGISACFLMRYS